MGLYKDLKKIAETAGSVVENVAEHGTRGLLLGENETFNESGQYVSKDGPGPQEAAVVSAGQKTDIVNKELSTNVGEDELMGVNSREYARYMDSQSSRDPDTLSPETFETSYNKMAAGVSTTSTSTPTAPPARLNLKGDVTSPQQNSPYGESGPIDVRKATQERLDVLQSQLLKIQTKSATEFQELITRDHTDKITLGNIRTLKKLQKRLVSIMDSAHAGKSVDAEKNLFAILDAFGQLGYKTEVDSLKSGLTRGLKVEKELNQLRLDFYSSEQIWQNNPLSPLPPPTSPTRSRGPRGPKGPKDPVSTSSTSQQHFLEQMTLAQIEGEKPKPAVQLPGTPASSLHATPGSASMSLFPPHPPGAPVNVRANDPVASAIPTPVAKPSATTSSTATRPTAVSTSERAPVAKPSTTTSTTSKPAVVPTIERAPFNPPFSYPHPTILGNTHLPGKLTEPIPTAPLTAGQKALARGGYRSNAPSTRQIPERGWNFSGLIPEWGSANPFVPAKTPIVGPSSYYNPIALAQGTGKNILEVGAVLLEIPFHQLLPLERNNRPEGLSPARPFGYEPNEKMIPAINFNDPNYGARTYRNGKEVLPNTRMNLHSSRLGRPYDDDL